MSIGIERGPGNSVANGEGSLASRELIRVSAASLPRVGRREPAKEKRGILEVGNGLCQQHENRNGDHC